MTLLAAFQHNGVPILLGDFLIQSGSYSSAHKKVCLISPNFVVGWAGHLWAARPVLKDLHDRFQGECVSRAEVEQFLKNYPTSELGSLHVQLVMWIVDDAPRCFWWQSEYPEGFFDEPHHFAGSGAQAFQEIFEADRYGVASSERTNVEEAIFRSLNESCKLISDEVFEGLNRKQGFGFAFETLYFDGERFRYVDNVLYLAAEVWYDVQSDRIHHLVRPVTFKYRNFERYSVVQIDVLEEEKSNFYAVTSIFEDIPDLFDNIPGIDVSKHEAFPLASDYYCLYYRLYTSDVITSPGQVVIRAGQPENYVTISRTESGGEFLQIDFGFARTLYPFILNAGWGFQVQAQQKIDPRGGRVEFVIGQSDKNVAFALTKEGTDNQFTSLNHALWFRPGGLVQVYENGVYIGARAYAAEDTFGIDLAITDDGPLILYKHKEEIFHHSKALPNQTLVVRALMKEKGAGISKSSIRAYTSQVIDMTPEM
jgi:hypothetical protein